MSQKISIVKFSNTIINIKSTYNGTAKLQDILLQLALPEIRRKAENNDIILKNLYNTT